uniref:Predicted protein n=1 Tax=Hordeum vulgare subsp. vulgare TaxID=112509 RepID=F2D0X5_HORVV|nr:predicted protein [Hordeum vulgare subsp. vulgare]
MVCCFYARCGSDLLCPQASAPHLQHLYLKYSYHCTMWLDAMTVPSMGSSEEFGLGSWSKSNEDATHVHVG